MHLLTEIERKEWLQQHIVTRVYAVRADIPQLNKRRHAIAPENVAERLLYEYWFHAAWEGRHAALRWLIEFVLEPTADQKKCKHDDDLRIASLGGKSIPLGSLTAKKLKLLKRDLHKATGHPTHKSGHEEMTEGRIREAADIITRHLQLELYDRAKPDLTSPPSSGTSAVPPPRARAALRGGRGASSIAV